MPNIRMYDIPDDGAGETEVLAPALTVPAVEERLERDLRLRVQAIIAKETVVGGEREDDLRRARDEVAAGLLVLDRTEETEQVDEHNTMSELRLVIKTINLTTILRDSGEGEDVVQVETEGAVDIVDNGLDVLLGALVEGNHGESGAARAEALEDALVVFDGGATVARCSDDDVRATREQALQDLNADRAFADTSEERILVLECRAGGGDLMKDVEVYTRQVRRVLPVGAHLALEMKKRDLVGGDRSNIGDLRAQEL